MKRVFCLVLSLLLLAGVFAACGKGGEAGGSDGQEPVFSGDLTEYLDQVTDGATDPEMMLETVEVPEEQFSWIFFIDPVEGGEAVASMPLNGSIPYTVALLRLPEGADNGDALRDEIEEKMDPRKWICVEAEATAVLRRGNLILLAMGDKETVDAVKANFLAL